ACPPTSISTCPPPTARALIPRRRPRPSSTTSSRSRRTSPSPKPTSPGTERPATPFRPLPMDPAEDQNLDYQQGTVSTVDLHDAIRREDPLQPGGRGAVGGLVFVVSAIIVFLGGGQLFTASNGFRASI